jgi:nucleoid DNA-binding protein|nr:MAG TPA: hypothetical protein [Caudoviricetes sp.]DAV92990.1 MAG TPA: hypothetical protein [Bacteriophage sp.]
MGIIRFRDKDAIGRNKKEVKNITKTDIVNEIWQDNFETYTKKDIEFIVNSFITTAGNELKNNGKVKIEGFGTFSTYTKSIRNINGLDDNDIINAKYISFKPSKKIK